MKTAVEQVSEQYVENLRTSLEEILKIEKLNDKIKKAVRRRTYDNEIDPSTNLAIMKHSNMISDSIGKEYKKLLMELLRMHYPTEFH